MKLDTLDTPYLGLVTGNIEKNGSWGRVGRIQYFVLYECRSVPSNIHVVKLPNVSIYR